MKRLTQLAHEAVAQVLLPGDIAVDLTAGNGLDTLFMARCVGPTGHVYAFDIQNSAIEATKKLSIQHGIGPWVTVHQQSHADWSRQIAQERKELIKSFMINLGYLPGGDRTIVTQTHSTLVAIQSALDWLQPHGLISMLAYTGHPGGQAEADAVQAMLIELDSNVYEITREPAIPERHSPVLHLCFKK